MPISVSSKMTFKAILFLLLITLIDCRTLMSNKSIILIVEDGDTNYSLIKQAMNASFMYAVSQLSNPSINFDILTIKKGSNMEDVCERLPEFTTFIISGVWSTNTRALVKGVVERTNIPTIQITFNASATFDLPYLNESNSDYSATWFEIVPAITIFYNSLEDVLNQIKITNNVVVIYDDSVQQIDFNFSKYFSKLPQYNFTFIEASTLNKSVSSNLLAFTEKYKTLIFLCKTSVIERYVLYGEEAFEHNHFTWIVFTTDILPFKCNDCYAANIFWIRPYHSNRADNIRSLREYIGTINEGELIESFEEVFSSSNVITASMYFEIIQSVYNFLNVTNFEKDEISTSFCSQRSFWGDKFVNWKMINLSTIDNPNYGKYIGGIDGKENIVYQNVKVRIYKIVRRLDLAEGNMIKYLGNWSLTQNISTFYGSLTVDVYLLKTYRVVTIIQPPFTQWGKHESGDLFLEGYCIDLLSFIQNDLKINVELYLDEEGRFGSIDENGVWNGVVGDLVIGNADFAISPLSVMAERETDIDYTVPYYDLVGTAILMKKTVVDNSLFKFLQVLEWPVWLAILCAYVLTSLLLWLFDRISPYSYTNMIKKNNEMLVRRQFSMKECFWFCMTSLTPQGGGEVPLNISGRFISATWWVFGFIIIATYTANLAAFLTVSRLEQPISSLDDLANQYKIEYAPIKGGSSELYFRRMAAIEQKFYNIWKEMSLNESLNTMDRARLAVWDYPVSDKFSNLWKIMQESKLPENTEKAIERVLTSENGFAFIGDAMEIRYAVLTNCDLQQIGQEFSRKPYALGVQANHPLKDKLSTSILRLLNQRKLEFLKEKWWVQNPQKAQCTTSDGDANGITIENIGGVFIVIFVGIVLSIIMLIIEFYYHHHKQATIKRVNTTQSQGAMQISHSDYSTTSNIPNSPVTEEVEVMQLETLTLRRNTIQVIEEVTKF